MSKVLCIDTKPYAESYTPEILKFIKEGREYEIEQYGDATIGFIGPVYFLKGINTYPHGYASCRFIPLSDADEREMERNYNFEELTVKSDR